VPLHFVNAEISPAVKLSSAIISHVLSELDVQCLAKDLPEFIEVDLSELTAGHAVHASDLKLPAGVTAVIRGQNKNPVVASAVVPRGAVEEETEVAEGAAAAGGEVPATAQKAPDAKAPEGKSDAKADKRQGGRRMRITRLRAAGFAWDRGGSFELTTRVAAEKPAADRRVYMNTP
jgi:hypothetical protein